MSKYFTCFSSRCWKVLLERLLRAFSTLSLRRHLPSRFLFESSSVLLAILRSGFSSGFSPKPLHGSRDLSSRTGVADAKKFHRELTGDREETEDEGGMRGDNRWSTNEERDATLVEATARKRLPYGIECRSRQAEDYLNRHRGPRREETGEEMTMAEEEEGRVCNQVVFISCLWRTSGRDQEHPSSVRGRNAPDAIDSLRPSAGIRRPRRNRN